MLVFYRPGNGGPSYSVHTDPEANTMTLATLGPHSSVSLTFPVDVGIDLAAALIAALECFPGELLPF